VKRSMSWVFVAVAAVTLTLAALYAQGGAGAQAPAGGGGGGRRGGGAGGGGAARGGGAPTPGNLVTGVWGAGTVPLDSKGWGWQTKAYVSSDYKRPFYSRAKEMLFSDKQVTSYTIGRLDPQLYCETRKHFGFIWFEMQHSTMSWDDVAKMIAACPGPDGASPMIRMPDQMESSIQKATDLGAIGLVFPTMRDGHQALEAARYSRFPPFGRRSSGAGQAGTVWGNLPNGQQYQATFNDNMLVVIMLETLEGIIDADEIASTFGIDVVIQGNNDLSRFSGWTQTDDRYQYLLNVSRNAALKAGKYWGNAGAQYLTGNPLSADVRFVQNGPATDGWTPPARGRGPAEEPTIGMPGGAQPGGGVAPAGGGGRGRRGGGAGGGQQ
jgi:2-keto-3-deoxy-L-rhamnonate aldolase RhmA